MILLNVFAKLRNAHALMPQDRTRLKKRRSQPPKRLLDEYVPVSNAKGKKKMVKDNRLYEVEIVAID